MPKRRYKCLVLRSLTGELYRTDSISSFIKDHPDEFPNAQFATRQFYSCGVYGLDVVSRQTEYANPLRQTKEKRNAKARERYAKRKTTQKNAGE